MALKAEIIKQFSGFGNDIPESASEYFRSSGFTKSANGITGNKYLTSWFNTIATKYPQYSDSNIGDITAWASGYGRNITSGGGDDDSFMFALGQGGKIFQSLDGTGTVQLFYDLNKNASNVATDRAGFIVDQKKRLMISGSRYLHKFDPAVDDVAMSIDVVNGSGALVATFGSFTAGMVGKSIRFFDTASGDPIHYYRISSYTDATHVSISGTVSLPTGNYSAFVMDSFAIQWKDFGGSHSSDSEGNSAPTPTETYEDTVLFGRGSNITTLNVLTDTITTDASPAFTLPTGFDILEIHKGANGILIGANFQGKGVLVLWDNISTRSIAPWIDLPDRLISACKYNGGWIVITAREIYYTDGYSLVSLKKFFLDSRMTILEASTIPQTSFVSEDQLYFIANYASNGKRRAGMYKMDLQAKSFEMYPRQNLDQYNTKLKSLYYGAGFGSGRIYAGANLGIDYLLNDTETPVATYITNPVGEGENYKYAEAIKLNLGVSPQNSVKQSPYSFKITAKICPMEKQMFNVGLVKTTMADTTHVVVDETVYHIASEGDEIEFIDGESAGYSRNIISISGSGTNTATYTLDRAVPVVVSANYHFFITPFRLIKVKTYTNISEMPEVWFDIKNKPKGKKFMIKIDIEDSTVPIEIRPILFVYDDLGIL